MSNGPKIELKVGEIYISGTGDLWKVSCEKNNDIRYDFICTRLSDDWNTEYTKDGHYFADKSDAHGYDLVRKVQLGQQVVLRDGIRGVIDEITECNVFISFMPNIGRMKYGRNGTRSLGAHEVLPPEEGTVRPILSGVKVGQKVRRMNGEVGKVVKEYEGLLGIYIQWSHVVLAHYRNGEAPCYPDYTVVTLVNEEDNLTPKASKEKPSMEKKIELKIGQKYKDRDGNVWYVESRNNKQNYPFDAYIADSEDKGTCSFMSNGRYYSGEEHNNDLIELIEDVPVQQEKELVQETQKTDPPKITLKVGQKYKDRDGDVWAVSEQRDPKEFAYPFVCFSDSDKGYGSFMENGRYSGVLSSEKDLVELVEDAPTPEAQKEKAPAVEKQILEGVQVGQKVRRANGEIGEVVETGRAYNTTRVWWPQIGAIFHCVDGSAEAFPQYTIVALVPSEAGQEAVTHGDSKKETTDAQSESPSPIKNKYDFYPPGAVEYAEDVKLGDRVMVRHFQVWCEGYVVGVMDDGAVLSVLNRETGLDTQIQAGEEVVVVKKNNFPLMLPTQRWRTRGGKVVTLEHDTRDAGDLTTVEEDEEGLHSSYSENVPFIRCDPDWDLVECVSQQKTLFLSSSLEVYQVDDNIVMRQPQNKSFFVFGTGDREALMNGFESAASACYGFPTCLIARSLLAGMNK